MDKNVQTKQKINATIRKHAEKIIWTIQNLQDEKKQRQEKLSRANVIYIFIWAVFSLLACRCCLPVGIEVRTFFCHFFFLFRFFFICAAIQFKIMLNTKYYLLTLFRFFLRLSFIGSFGKRLLCLYSYHFWCFFIFKFILIFSFLSLYHITYIWWHFFSTSASKGVKTMLNPTKSGE